MTLQKILENQNVIYGHEVSDSLFNELIEDFDSYFCFFVEKTALIEGKIPRESLVIISLNNAERIISIFLNNYPLKEITVLENSNEIPDKLSKQIKVQFSEFIGAKYLPDYRWRTDGFDFIKKLKQFISTVYLKSDLSSNPSKRVKENLLVKGEQNKTVTNELLKSINEVFSFLPTFSISEEYRIDSPSGFKDTVNRFCLLTNKIDLKEKFNRKKKNYTQSELSSLFKAIYSSIKDGAIVYNSLPHQFEEDGILLVSYSGKYPFIDFADEFIKLREIIYITNYTKGGKRYESVFGKPHNDFSNFIRKYCKIEDKIQEEIELDYMVENEKARNQLNDDLSIVKDSEVPYEKYYNENYPIVTMGRMEAWAEKNLKFIQLPLKTIYLLDIKNYMLFFYSPLLNISEGDSKITGNFYFDKLKKLF